MHVSWDINFATLATSIPMLIMMIKMYGDWTVIKDRIDAMWFDYCKEHNIPFENGKR